MKLFASIFIFLVTNLVKCEEDKRISVQKCEEYNQNSNKFLRPMVAVVGGKAAYKNEFPHMAAIGWRLLRGNILWDCGGSLISEKFVLSAAHCSFSYNGKPNLVRLGDLKLSNFYKDPNNYRIKNIFNHPYYRNGFGYHDITLFELSQRIKIGPSIKPACLHQDGEDLSEFTISGWGHTSFNGKSSNILLKGDLSVVNNFECNSFYKRNYAIPYGILNNQICAWDESGRDTCNGDSGGPAQIIKFSNGKSYYEIVGITSFGQSCGIGIPGVYTKVSNYLNWIEQIVWPQF